LLNKKTSFTYDKLDPSSTYRFRVIPIYSKGRGAASRPITVTTLPPTTNYWEPLTARRFSLARTGRGLSYPVLQTPHLDPGSIHPFIHPSIHSIIHYIIIQLKFTYENIRCAIFIRKSIRKFTQIFRFAQRKYPSFPQLVQTIYIYINNIFYN
jgi:hypothetical protein